MSTPNPTSIQIFRAGSQTAMSGEEMSFSEADLAASCAAYDPAVHEAPLVIGHPRHNSPAWGWVQSMAVSGQHLEATPHQLDPEFAELVRAGRFKKISASFYRPDSPNNPVPGVWYLRHVGFLGAQPPAVKGLRQVEFGEPGEQGVVEFSDWGMEANASLWRRLRDWLLAERGQDVADQVVPDWQIESIREAARQDDDDPRPAFSETNTPQQEPHVTPEQAAAIETENAKLKKQLADALAEKQSAAHASNVSFAEQLIAAGKLLPKHQAVVIAALDVASPPDAPLEFSEGEGVKQRPLADGLRELFQQLPPVVEFGELATTARAGSAPSNADVAEFAEKSTDPDRLSMHARAMCLAHDKNIPYEQAARLLAGR